MNSSSKKPYAGKMFSSVSMCINVPTVAVVVEGMLVKWQTVAVPNN